MLSIPKMFYVWEKVDIFIFLKTIFFLNKDNGIGFFLSGIKYERIELPYSTLNFFELLNKKFEAFKVVIC